MAVIRGLPKISETEKAALEAGTVWMEADWFRGRPDFSRLLSSNYPSLSPEEQAFLDRPVEEICRRVDPWTLEQTRSIDPEIWNFLKQQGFFGLTLPTSYGGLGFSPLGASTVFGKLASRSLALSAIVLIPNSVGPGELLLEYGTEAQRHHYLPRLACGDELPCFALTEPEAGSDAAALRSKGIVFAGDDGRAKIRLDFEKRYITLAPVATLIGLAIRLEDPENLLGKGVEPGITCVLVPANTPGVEQGQRHDPMGVPFPNGPLAGRGVVVDADQILGGPSKAGDGWRMLMEALSAGRAISLPAQSVGGAKALLRVASAYAGVRRQFGVPLHRFEGVEEPLVRLALTTYQLDAARVLTCGAISQGHRPSVVSAILKVQATEHLRDRVADAMDIFAGAAICRGPSNPLGDANAGAPIGITVEGANILTRSLIVFGQGALRCHRHLAPLLRAAQGEGSGLLELLRHLGGWIFDFLALCARVIAREITRGHTLRWPGDPRLSSQARRLGWASGRFALLSELALIGLGPKLKFAERLSGRFADALSALFLGAAVLRRFEAEGCLDEDLPLARGAVEASLRDIEEALGNIAENLPGLVGLKTRWVLGPWMRLWRTSNRRKDRNDRQIGRALSQPSPARDRWTENIFLGTREQSRGALLDDAFAAEKQTAALVEKLVDALGRPEFDAFLQTNDHARLKSWVTQGHLSTEEGLALLDGLALRNRVLAVDAFDPESHFPLASGSSPDASSSPSSSSARIATSATLDDPAKGAP